jgi:hypothetical protein
MIGVLVPDSGNGHFQTMLRCSCQTIGRFLSLLTPVPSGPRHAGQSAAWTVSVAEAETIRMQVAQFRLRGVLEVGRCSAALVSEGLADLLWVSREGFALPFSDFLGGGFEGSSWRKLRCAFELQKGIAISLWEIWEALSIEGSGRNMVVVCRRPTAGASARSLCAAVLCDQLYMSSLALHK